MIYYIIYFKYIFQIFYILNKMSDQSRCQKSQTINIWRRMEYILIVYVPCEYCECDTIWVRATTI
jgi:hypothetical protein